MNFISWLLCSVISLFYGKLPNDTATSTLHLPEYRTTPTVNDVLIEAVNGAPRSKKMTPQVVEKLADASSICLTPECINIASSILENMNPSVEPCDDFYQFACGNFLKNTIIPNDKPMATAFDNIAPKLYTQLSHIIEEESKPNDIKPFQLVKTLYKACMNKSLIEEQGLKTLHRILKDLGGWPILMGDKWIESDFNWKESVYRFRRIGDTADYLINFRIVVDLKNSTKHVIGLDQASLGLSREYLSEGMENQIVKAYYNYMVDIANILGADKDVAANELKDSLKFEMELANISLPSEERRNATALYNPMTVSQLQKKFPSIPWLEFINTLLKPSASVTEDEIVNVSVPDYIASLEKLLEQTPKRVQANYVMWRFVASSVIYLNDEIRKRQLAYSTVESGKTEEVSRSTECFGTVSDSLPTDWMDDETRKAALDKAESMKEYIGYPDELLDDSKLEEYYKKLELAPDNYFENILNISRFMIDSSFDNLRKPVNKSDLVTRISPTTVDAFYLLNENSIYLPAGILQGVFFSHDRPRYMNYGAIGFAMGHEITHGFDDEGRQFDKEGNLIEWWMDKTKENYLNRVECIIHQYGNYTASDVKLKLNGINTQGENIADNGGIKAAYRAYNEWVRRNKPEQLLPGLKYTPQQMFWISAANMMCTKYRPEFLKQQITNGVTSPSEFRINGPLSNTPEFAKDFNCPVNSTMNPQNKCSVW